MISLCNWAKKSIIIVKKFEKSEVLPGAEGQF